MRVAIDAMELLKWGQGLRKKQLKFRGAAARVLNEVGSKVVNEMVSNVAAQSGLAESTVRRRFTVQRASEGNLTFQVTAASELTADKASRPMHGREFERRPETFFRESELVNIVTAGDDRVCPLCEALAEGNPYTIEEARAQIPHHPNCRCVVKPVRGERREQPEHTRSRGGGGPLVQNMEMTLDELVVKLGRETNVILAAT